MKMQLVNVKVYVEDPSQLNLEEFNSIFQTWIQQKVTDGMLIDVADYLHVPEGPGMVLIGLEEDYSMDESDRRLGLRYNRKAAVAGSNQDRLKAAFKEALEACRRLEADPKLQGKIKFKLDEIECFLNDRALAPNTEESLAAARPDLEKFLKQLFQGGDFSLEHDNDPRVRFGVTIKTDNAFDLESLIKNLS